MPYDNSLKNIIKSDTSRGRMVKRFTAAMEKLGIKINDYQAEDKLMQFVKMHYASEEKEWTPVADIIADNSLIDNMDVYNAVTFLETNTAADVLNLEDYYLQEVSKITLEDLQKANPNRETLDSLKNTPLTDLFSALHTDDNKNYEEAKHACNALCSVAELLHAKSRPVLGAESVYAHMVYNCFAPLIKGRTMEQCGRLDRANSRYDTLIHVMLNSQGEYDEKGRNYPFKNAFRALTMDDAKEYDEKGKWPASITPGNMQSVFSGMLKWAVEKANEKRGDDNKINEYALPAPVIDGKINASKGMVAKRFAEDAVLSMLKKGGVSAEAAAEYGRIFEMQAHRLLLESTGAHALISSDVENSERAFYYGSNKLPYNVDMKVIEKASAIALEGMKAFYPKEADAVKDFKPQFNYSTDRPLLLTSDTAYGLSVPQDVKPFIIAPKMTESSQETFLRNINLKTLAGDAAADLSAVEEYFDGLVNANPQLKNCIAHPVVAQEYGSAAGLFFIDGKSAEKYVSSAVSGYSSLSEEKKTALKKAAIVSALLSGKHNIDVKYYVQNDRRICSAAASSVVYADFSDKTENVREQKNAASRAKKLTSGDKLPLTIENTSRANEHKLHFNFMAQTNDILEAEQLSSDNAKIADNAVSRCNQILASASPDWQPESNKSNIVKVAKLFKIYNGKGQYSAEDIIHNRVNIDAKDIGDMLSYMDAHPWEENANSSSMAQVADIQANFINAVKDLKLEDFAAGTPTGIFGQKYEISRLADTANAYFTMFENHNSLFAGKSISKEDNAAFNNYVYITNILNAANGGTLNDVSGAIAYRTLAPMLGGRSMRELNKIYPADDTGSGYISVLAEKIYEKFESLNGTLSPEQLDTFRITGALPADENWQKYQKLYDEAYKESLQEYTAHGGKIAPCDMPAPLNFDSGAARSFDKAVKKVAEDATTAMEKINGQLLAAMEGRPVSREALGYYRKTVETQLKRLLIEDGYIRKSNEAADKNVIINDLEHFDYNGNPIPYFFTTEIIDKAMDLAREGLKEHYPEEAAKCSAYKPMLSYYTIKPDLTVKPFSSITHVLSELSPTGDFNSDLVAPDANEAAISAITSLNPDKPDMANMITAVKTFDALMAGTPQAMSMDNKVIAGECKSIVNMFYVDGKDIATFMKDVNGYTGYSVKEKEFLTKAFLMKAIIDGNHIVQAKTFTRGSSNKCKLQMANFVCKHNMDSIADRKNKSEEYAKNIIAEDKIAAKVNAAETKTGIVHFNEKVKRPQAYSPEDHNKSVYFIDSASADKLAKTAEMKNGAELIAENTVVPGLSAAMIKNIKGLSPNTPNMEHLAAAEKAFDDMLVKQRKVLDTYKDEDVKKGYVKITDLFTVDGVIANKYLDTIKAYNNCAYENKESYAKAYIMKAILCGEQSVLAKTYSRGKDNKYSMKLEGFAYDRDEDRRESFKEADEEFAAKVISGDSFVRWLNDNAEKNKTAQNAKAPAAPKNIPAAEQNKAATDIGQKSTETAPAAKSAETPAADKTPGRRHADGNVLDEISKGLSPAAEQNPKTPDPKQKSEKTDVLKTSEPKSEPKK